MQTARVNFHSHPGPTPLASAAFISMKRFSILPLVALAFLANACEKHPAAELPEEGQTAFGEHAAKHESEAKPEAKKEEAAAPKAEAPVAAAPAKPEDAPKFFPDKK